MRKLLFAVGLMFAMFTFADAQVQSLGYDKDGDEWTMELSIVRHTKVSKIAALETELSTGAVVVMFTEFFCSTEKMRVHKGATYIGARKVYEEDGPKKAITPYGFYAEAFKILCRNDSM